MCLEQSVLNNTTHTKKHRKSLKKHFILSLRNPAVILDKFGLTSKKQQLMMVFSFLISSESYISNMDQASQQVASDMLYPFYSKDLYIGLIFQISPIVSEQVVQFPKFNEVLADTGSMVSIIFYISILAKLINEKSQDMEAINQVISFYYPKFNQIRFQCNWSGLYQRVYYQDKLLDPNKFKQYYEKLVQIARQKLSLSNQLYEISRLQFIIQSLQPRKYIKKSHNIGIQLQYQIDSDIQLNEDKEEKIVLDQIFHLKSNDSKVSPLQIQPSERQQQYQDYLLLNSDFGLLLNLQENQENSVNSLINIDQFYKTNLIE